MMNESESGQHAQSGSDIPISSDTGVAISPTPNVHPHSAKKIKKPRGTPKTGEIIIFTTILVGFAALMSRPNFRCFIDTHAAGISAFATIAVMALTAFYVVFARSQWIVMEDQLEAMHDQIAATRNSIELQKIQFKQWLEITNWTGGNLVHEEMQRRSPHAYFDIINPTSNPLTLKRITIIARGEKSALSFQHLLTPHSKYSSDLIIQITPEEAQNYVMERKPLVFHITGEIGFSDIMKNEEAQPFRFLAHFKYGETVKIDYTWG
jgi:hypothetical protein